MTRSAMPSLGAILRERSTRPDEDAPPHVQPQIIAGSTKKMHATDYRARQPPRKLDRAEFTSEPSGQLERHDERGRRCHCTRRGSAEAVGGSAASAMLGLNPGSERIPRILPVPFGTIAVEARHARPCRCPVRPQTMLTVLTQRPRLIVTSLDVCH